RRSARRQRARGLHLAAAQEAGRHRRVDPHGARTRVRGRECRGTGLMMTPAERLQDSAAARRAAVLVEPPRQAGAADRTGTASEGGPAASDAHHPASLRSRVLWRVLVPPAMTWLLGT